MAVETSRNTVPESPEKDVVVINDTDDEIVADISEFNRCCEDPARRIKKLFECKDVWMKEMEKFGAASALFSTYQDEVEKKMKECVKKLDLNFDFDVFVGSTMADRDEILTKISPIKVDDEVHASISEMNRFCGELDSKMKEYSASMNVWKEENEKFKAEIEMFVRDHNEVKNMLNEFKSRFGEFSDQIFCNQELNEKMDKMEKCRSKFRPFHGVAVMHCDISTDPTVVMHCDVSTDPVFQGFLERSKFDIGEEERSSSEDGEIESSSEYGSEMEEEEEEEEEAEEGVMSSEEMDEEATDTMNNSMESGVCTNIDGLAEEMYELKRKFEEEDDQKLKAVNLKNLKTPRRD